MVLPTLLFWAQAHYSGAFFFFIIRLVSYRSLWAAPTLEMPCFLYFHSAALPQARQRAQYVFEWFIHRREGYFAAIERFFNLDCFAVIAGKLFSNLPDRSVVKGELARPPIGGAALPQFQCAQHGIYRYVLVCGDERLFARTFDGPYLIDLCRAAKADPFLPRHRSLPGLLYDSLRNTDHLDLSFRYRNTGVEVGIYVEGRAQHFGGKIFPYHEKRLPRVVRYVEVSLAG